MVRYLCRVPSAPTAFTHPGVLVSQAQLDFVRDRVAAGEQPWAGALRQARDSRYADLSRAPAPRPVVDCGPYSRPNHGCTDEREDAIAAYTTALLWYLTGDERYARQSIALLDAWSATITGHTNLNAPLQAGWAASVWPRAAEIIRYGYRDWPGAGRFAAMLRDVYLPAVIGGSHRNGNWELTMMEAAVGIAVHLDDPASYRRAVARFVHRVPAYVYLPADGPGPHLVAGQPDDPTRYWHGQTTFVPGLAQETCRDFTHTGYGLAAIAHVAETSRIQGRDLYPQVAQRLGAALEFHARFELGAPVPDWLGGGRLDLGLGPVTEVGFNALHHRGGMPLPDTARLTHRQRPAGSNHLFVAWETLTHAGNPN
jgi:Alginate lyase